MQEEKQPECGGFWSLLLELMIPAVLLTGSLGAFQSLVGIYDMAPVLTAGLSVIGLEYLFIKKGRWLWGLNGFLGLAVLLGFLPLRTMTLDGLKLICNQIFLLSETQYAYIYDKFNISSAESQYENCLKAAFVLIAVLAALICVFAVRHKNPICLICLFAGWTGAELYFGIAPAYGWNVFLYGAMGLAAFSKVSRKDGRKLNAEVEAKMRCLACGFIAIIVALTGAVTWAVYPEENNALDLALTQRAKVIRDRFDSKVEQYDQKAKLKEREIQQKQEEERRLKEERTKENREKEQAYDSYGIKSQEASPEAEPAGLDLKEIFKNLFIILMACLFFLVLPVWIYSRRKEAARRKADFEDPCCRAAIERMFAHTMKWLKAGGLAAENCVAAGYTGKVTAMLSPLEGEAYLESVGLWQEARYSSHEMNGQQRDQMKERMEKITEAIWEKAGFLSRIKIKWRYFLS